MDYVFFCRHFDVPRETFDRLTAYAELLIKWQTRINLISSKTIADVWSRHILDSCQFDPLIVPRGTSLADLGSGAGLPGAVLSILGHPHITLIESDQRKAVFLNEVKRMIAPSLTINSTRIENMREHYDVITARGCAALSQLLTWAYPLSHPHTLCLFAKGKNYAKEIEDANQRWRFDVTCHASITEEGAAILAIRNVTPRG